MKIAFFALRDFDELPFAEKFKEKYGIDFVWTSEYPNKDNLQLAEGCDGVSFTPCEITEEYVKAFHDYGVRYLLCRSIGYDHIPCEYAHSLGMHVSTSPYPVSCVANYALMLILMTARKMQQIMLRAAAQDYTLKGKMGMDLDNATIGVLGTGAIGRTLIRHLSSFGCKIYAYDLYQNDEVKKYAEYVDLPTLFAHSDIISIHLPANAATHHLINEQAIAQMKNGVLLINTARGSLIDSKAMIAALKSGKIGGAALDVLENENGLYYYNRMGDHIDNDELAMLRSFPNVIVSPHTAFYVESTVSNMVEKSFLPLYYASKGEENPFEIKVK